MPIYRQQSPNAPFTLFRFSVQHLPSFVLAIALVVVCASLDLGAASPIGHCKFTPCLAEGPL